MSPQEKLRRSLLFVPGGDERKIEKARDAGADVIVFDLEDSVGLEAKVQARKQVADAIRSAEYGSSELAVRLNAPNTPYFKADLEAAISAGARAIMVPKAEDATELERVGQIIDDIEVKLGIAGHHLVRLFLLVETAVGISRVQNLGAATPKIDALCFGHADFSLDMGLDDPDPARGVVLHARCQLSIAAKACNVSPIDNICPQFKDEGAFRIEAEFGMRLGFEGKLCIHPAQVRIANDVYTPTSDQIAYASRLVDAWSDAHKEGRAVFRLDNKMIDAPLVEIQRRVLERARLAGVL